MVSSRSLNETTLYVCVQKITPDHTVCLLSCVANNKGDYPCLTVISAFLLFSLAMIVSPCNRMCQNGGTLAEASCTCDCADGFSGDNCESECIVMRLAITRDMISNNYF